ncbi:MAG: hypothetical protein P8Z37_06105 [Acidobacteriota bacterium]
MKMLGTAIVLLSVGFCSAQQTGNFKPSETNVWGSEYPRIDDAGRVQALSIV